MSQGNAAVYSVRGSQPANMHVQFQPAGPNLPPTTVTRSHTLLRLYIIDYCEKNKFLGTAEALKREADIGGGQKAPVESKEGLLYEWWACFWEVYTARVHPDRAHSKVAKEYSEALYQNEITVHRDSGPPPNQRLAGPQTVPGHPPLSVNGHGPSVQYVNAPPGAQNVAGPMSGNSGYNPTPLENPTLQHLQQAQAQAQQQQQRPPNGRQFSSPGMPGSQPGPPHPMTPGTQMQPRVMANGVPVQANPNLRQMTGQQSNSPQNQEPQSSPRNSDNTNPPQEASDPTKFPDSQKTPRRGRKRPSEGESSPKGETPPDRKKLKPSPPENGAALPGTPSLATAQPVANGRPFPPGFTQPKPGMPYPQHPGPPLPTLARNPSLPAPQPYLMNQPREPEAMHNHRNQIQNQQHFQRMQEDTISAYKPGSLPPTTAGPPVNNTMTDQSTQFPRTTAVGATISARGAMLPPPPPGGLQQPPTPVSTAPKAPMANGLLPPQAVTTKDGSPKIDVVSPENTRPGSRPTPSTPQIPSAPIPAGVPSTPGGQPAMSVHSPSQLATPQQISRPQSQSPNARPSTAGAMGSVPPPTPAALLARNYGSGSSPGGAPQTAVPGVSNPTMTPISMGNNSMMTPSNSFGGSGSVSIGGDSSTADLFSLDMVGAAPFDFQMMNFQETPFEHIGFSDFTMEEFTPGLFPDGPLDSMTGTGA